MPAAFDKATWRNPLIVIPNWVGDVVMATPVLAALRAAMPHARITYLLRGYVQEVVAGGGWHDEAICWPNRSGLARLRDTADLVRRLRRGRHDLALLLTNSFRSALVARLAGIPHRVGYARDGRGRLLTSRLRPQKERGEFVPLPVLDYYAALAEHVGCDVTQRKLHLSVSPEQERQGQELRAHYGMRPPYAVVNPGAKFGAAKCWPAERFAELCDGLTERGLSPVLVGSRDEVPLMRSIAQQAHAPVTCCDEPGTTLGSLKVIVRDAAVLVCNDTGPRHYGNAFDVPTVTIFGPTHQEWTDTGYAGEIKLQANVPCGPCQLPVCPIDLRCMREMSTYMVLKAVDEILVRRARRPTEPRSAAPPPAGSAAQGTLSFGNATRRVAGQAEERA